MKENNGYDLMAQYSFLLDYDGCTSDCFTSVFKTKRYEAGADKRRDTLYIKQILSQCLAIKRSFGTIGKAIIKLKN